MYLYHVLFTLINIYGVDCQKKICTVAYSVAQTLNVRVRIHVAATAIRGNSPRYSREVRAIGVRAVLPLSKR
jgi:hypothetical protein